MIFGFTAGILVAAFILFAVNAGIFITVVVKEKRGREDCDMTEPKIITGVLMTVAAVGMIFCSCVLVQYSGHRYGIYDSADGNYYLADDFTSYPDGTVSFTSTIKNHVYTDGDAGRFKKIRTEYSFICENRLGAPALTADQIAAHK